MTAADVILGGQWIFLAYFVGINLGYLSQNVIATMGIRRYLQTADQFEAEGVFSALDIPISVVVPAYNESASIISSVKALLQLEYPDFELVVVNDGSSDDTLEKLIEAFGLQPFPEAYRARVECKPVKTIYRSARYRNLRVIDKENGGCKADASNAGINACRYPLSGSGAPNPFRNPTALPESPRRWPWAAPCASRTAAPCARVSWRRWGCRATSWRWCRWSSICARSCSDAWAGRRSTVC